MLLVFGPTGKLGSEVVRLLSKAGVSARAFARDPARVKAGPSVEVVRGDLEDRASVDRAVAGIEAAFLATAPNPGHELGVIEAARAAGVRKVVKVSSMAIDGDPDDRIARGHATAEQALKSSGMAWTILRPGMFAQNFLAFAESIRRTGRIVASAGRGKAAPIDARDIAAVGVQTLLDPKHDGQTYLLTGPEPVGYADAARAIGTALGKPVEYADVPPEETRKALLGRGLEGWYVEELLRRQAFVAATERPVVTDAVARVLGRPARRFEDFVRDHAAAFA